jgi:hypothetical protein
LNLQEGLSTLDPDITITLFGAIFNLTFPDSPKPITGEALVVSGTTFTHVPNLALSSGPYTVTVAAGESKVEDKDGVVVAESVGGSNLLNDGVTSGLIAHWKFDGNFVDATGNYPLTTTGITFESPGYFGQAMKMDSDTDEVKTTSNFLGASGITDSTPVTFSAWVKRTRTGVTRDFIFSIGAAGTDTQLGASFMPADTLEFYIYAGNTITTTTTFTANIWYFLTFTRSATEEMRVYSNAQLQGSQTQDNTLAAVGSLYIGQMSAGNHFNDRSRNIIDDFRVYNRVLTDAEIKTIYHAGARTAITGTMTTYTAPLVIVQYHAIACPPGSGPSCTTVADPTVLQTDVRSGLIAQYKFDELGGGEGVLDSSGNGKTLTAHNVRYENLAWKSRDSDTDVDYFEVANDGYFSPQKLTISFWIKMDTNEFGTVVSCRESPGWNGWIIYHNSGNQLLFWTGTSSTWDSVTLDNAFDGTWQHFVITLDGTSATNNVEIFRDKVSHGKNSKGYARAMKNNMRIGEGGNEVSVGTGWDPITSNSYLDEFRMYDRVLSQSEINTVYEHSSHLLPSAITPAVVDPSVKSKFLTFDQLGTTTLEFTDATTGQALLVSGSRYTHVPTLTLSSGTYTVTVGADASVVTDAAGAVVATSAGGTEYTMQKDYIFIKENAWCDGVTSTMKYSHDTNPQKDNGQAAIEQACFAVCSNYASFNINPDTGACFCFDASSEECGWDTDSTYSHYDIVAGSFFNNITASNMKYFFPQVILRYDSEVCPTTDTGGPSCPTDGTYIAECGCPKDRFLNSDTTECSPCPSGKLAPKNSTSPGACKAPAARVRFSMSLGGSITASQITEAVKTVYVDRIAARLEIPASRIRIVSVQDARRRLLAVSLQVEIDAVDDDDTSALQASQAAVAEEIQEGSTASGLDATVQSTTTSVEDVTNAPSTCCFRTWPDA